MEKAKKSPMTDSKNSPKKSDLKKLRTLKTIEQDQSNGLICDINTGICGPVKQKEAGEK